MIGISRPLICSKTLMELIFNPCGEFRWSPDGPVSQIHSPHLHVGAPGNFTDLLRYVQMLKKESGVRKATGSYRTYLDTSYNCSFGYRVCGGRPAFGRTCNLGSWVCSGRPAFGQNCDLGSWICGVILAFAELQFGSCACSEGPAFGKNTLIMNINYYEMFYLLEHEINESVWKTVNEEKKSIAKREITNLLWERWRTKRLLIFRWPVPQRIPLQPG